MGTIGFPQIFSRQGHPSGLPVVANSIPSSLMTAIDVERRLRGTGTFVLTNGAALPPQAFRIEQSTSGRTFLYCERTMRLTMGLLSGGVAGFTGQTTSGRAIRTQGELNEYFNTSEEFCFVIRNVEVGQSIPDGHTHDLALTNLRFPENNPDPVAFTVAWGNTIVPIQLIPRKNYQQRVRQLAKTRGIIPTSTLRFEIADLSGDALAGFITDFCHALSIIQGGKVNWIYHATYGRKRAFQHAVFGNTITKSDTTQPLCFIPTTRSAVSPP